MNNSVTQEYVKKALPAKVMRLGIILLVIGLLIGAAGFLVDSHRIMFSYLLSFTYILTLALGAMFLFAIEYVAGADWSTPIRRVPEVFASLTPLLLVLVIPVLFSTHTLYEWTHQEIVAQDHLLQKKEPYLNTSFFVIRIVFILVLWTLFYFAMIRNSRKQDETKDQTLTKKNIKLGAVFIIVFAITVSMVGVDLLMTMQPHWFSTMWGVYFFSGSVVATLAAVTLATVLLKERGFLHPKMHNDSYYSLGALLFGFVNFWAYIAFSQFMLIWYANLPETTFWYLQRWEGGWMWLSLLLIVAHFLVPYIVLLSQPAKTDPKRLKFISIWLLVAHLVDLYWTIMPVYHYHGSHEGFGFLGFLTEFGFPIAVVGVFLIAFYLYSKKHNLVPVGDPKLDRGLNFRL